MNRIGVGASVIAGFLAAAGGAFAQSRPSTTNMSCAQAQATVKNAGAVVLGTGGYSYDRYVTDRAYCTFQETTVPRWVPTRDNPQCFIGFVCESVAGRDPSPN